VADEVADLDGESDPDSDSDVDGEIASEDEGWARPEPGEGEEGDAAAEDMQVHEDELRAELEMCTQRCDEIRKTLHETRSFIKGKGPTSGAEAKGERPEVAGVVLGAARATDGDGGAVMTNDGGRGGARGGGGGGYDIAAEARGAERPAAREGRVAADEYDDEFEDEDDPEDEFEDDEEELPVANSALIHEAKGLGPLEIPDQAPSYGGRAPTTPTMRDPRPVRQAAKTPPNHLIHHPPTHPPSTHS